MKTFKLVLDMPDGGKVWINISQMVKMEKTPDGHYFLYLVNGDMYEISLRTARLIENCLEGR